MTDDATKAMASQSDADVAYMNAHTSGPLTASMQELLDLRIAAAIAPLEERIAGLERRVNEVLTSSKAPFDPDSGQSPLAGLGNPDEA